MNVIIYLYIFIIMIGGYTMDWSFEYTRESSYWKMISPNRICKSGINNNVVSKEVNSIFVKENVNIPSRCKSVEKGRIYLLLLNYIEPIFFVMDAKTSWMSSSIFTSSLLW
jgi:hypothetical protein